MEQSLVAVTLVVRDYDEAIAYYTKTLDFELLEDTPMGDGKRWVRIAPRGANRVALLLARAVTEEQRAAVGNQTGGRVAFFLHTDDFARDHAAMSARGVQFLGAPRTEPYGRVVVFEDLYGNRWDFIEPAGRGA
jgi:catechol 2,3-dioxygenase-like lactoylglutathione lyase family enzyme